MMKGIVEYFGPNKTNPSCGYCKSTKPDDSSYGLWAHELTTDQYQIMVDRGWRRSGKFCYKSALDKICCPAFAIRCEALNCRLSRSQRKVIKRFNDFINHGIKPKFCVKESHPSAQLSQDIEIAENGLSTQSSSKSTLNHHPDTLTAPASDDNRNSDFKIKDKTRKARYLRLQRRVVRIISRNNCSEEQALNIIKEKVRQKSQRSIKPYEDYFKNLDRVDKPVHQFKIKFVATSAEEFIRTFKVSHQLYEKYQTKIHLDEPGECTPQQFRRFLIDNPFELRSFYKGPKDSISTPTSYGTHHMQYWLDDKLIAVAVLDILSHSLSSVYLYYDPEYGFLSLGTYSALREILLVRELHKINPSISYYYLGLYIHSCPKMNYKAKYYPSFLLCDQTLTWNPIEKCKEKLKHHPYPRFEDDPNKKDEDQMNIEDDDILILYSRTILTYSVYKNLSGSNDSDEVYEYARLMGKKSTRNLLLYRKAESKT